MSIPEEQIQERIGLSSEAEMEGEGSPGPSASQGQPLRLLIHPDVARGEYANFFQIHFNPIEMVLDFCRIIPDANLVEVVTRVLIHPRQSQLLLEMLRMNQEAYNQQFGSPAGPGALSTGAAPSSIGFRTSEDLRRMGLDVPAPRRINLPSDPSKPDPGAAAKAGKS